MLRTDLLLKSLFFIKKMLQSVQSINSRYVMIIFPTRHKRQHNLALLLFASIWIISIALALPLLITADLNVVYKDEQCNMLLKVCQEKNEIWRKVH